MKVFLAGVLTASMAFAGDCRVVSQQVVYPNAVAVGAVPLTAGYLVDLQAYQYRVNPAFGSYQEYQAGKSKSVVKSQSRLSSEDHRAIALEVLALMREQGIVTGESPQSHPVEVVASPAAGIIAVRCAKCHGPVDPKGGLILVDATGSALKSLPWKKIQGRVNSPDPELRMPPKGMPEEETVQLNEFLKGKVK